MKLEQDVCNGSKRKQIYKCDWLWQTGYYAKTKQKGGRGMREGWEYKKLGDSCVIEYGTRVVQKKDGGTIYPVYGGGGETFRMDKYNRENCLVVARFAMSRTCVRYVTGKFFLNDSGLSINAGKELLQSYLNHHILYLNDDIYNLGKGAAQRNLDVNSLRNLIIAIPPLSTQLSIVSELDKINELIRLKKEQLGDYEKLAQSLFYEMFGDPVENEKGWEVKKLGEEYKVSSSKRIMQDEWTTEGVPFLKVSDVVSKINGQNSEPSTFISETTYSKLVDSNAVPVQNDILITSRGTLGLCYIVKNEDRFYFQDGMITWLAECKGNITPLFLTYLFKNHHFLQQITSKANKSTVAYISISQISKREIPLPPLALQNLFAQRIELIEQQKAEIKSTIADLETLLASRMQYWFFGF